MSYIPVIAAIASWALTVFALMMLISNAYGIWWEIAFLPVGIAGGFAIGSIFGTVRALTRTRP